VPFVLAGRAAGEPTLLSVPSPAAAAVREQVGTSAGLTVLPEPTDRRPGTDIVRFQALVPEFMAGGTPVRVVNQIPPTLYRNWYEWRRYEAAINVAVAHLDVWGMCVYDARQLTPGMVQDLLATHPFTGRGIDRHANPAYQEPRAFCDAHFDAPTAPVEQTQPALDLLDPSPAAARAAVRDLAGHRAGLTDDNVEALVLAAHEALANAWVHGRPPVVVRRWAPPGRVVVTVTDTGEGPQDSFLGMLYSPDHQGMWISHQLVDVAHRRHAGGYTTRLTAPAGQSLP